MSNIYLIVLAYLIGSFPTGTILAKIYGINLYSAGSGSIGATNVARVIGKSAGLLTLIVDVLKGALAVYIVNYLSNDTLLAYLAGLAAVMGHCYSFPLLLKGGKGVATALGVIFSLSSYLGLATLVIFLISFYFSRIVSLSSIITSLCLGIITSYLSFNQSEYCALTAICLIVILRHKDNIKRLLAGEEKIFTWAKKKEN